MTDVQSAEQSCKDCGGTGVVAYDDAHGEPRSAPCPCTYARTSNQCAWLIEANHDGGNFRWLKHFTSAGRIDWTRDANEAVQFVRKADAEAVRPVVQVFCPPHWNTQAKEHMWPAVETSRDARGFPLAKPGIPIEAICAACSCPMTSTDGEWFTHDCDCMHRGAVKTVAEPAQCEHLRSELLAEKQTNGQPLFEMRRCLCCTQIFRVRRSVTRTNKHE